MSLALLGAETPGNKEGEGKTSLLAWTLGIVATVGIGYWMIRDLPAGDLIAVNDPRRRR